jgi:hypothetical protein
MKFRSMELQIFQMIQSNLEDLMLTMSPKQWTLAKGGTSSVIGGQS